MAFVQRDVARKINGVFSRMQSGYAEEELPDNHPEILAYLNPPDDPRKVAFDNDPDRIDIFNRLRSSTPAQVDQWIDTNVTSLAAARQVLKAIVKSLAILPTKRA